MTLEPEKLGQLESSTPGDEADRSPDEAISAIFKVSEPDYVPPGIKLRGRIDAVMFTGEVPARRLREVESDPRVVSVTPSKTLGMID